MAIEFAGIYLHNTHSNKLIKLCDTLSIQQPTISYSENQLKTTLKSLFGTMDNDHSEKRSLNITHSFYIYHHSDTYFVFIARSELTNEGKLWDFYTDLKKDMNPLCRGNLKNLQHEDLENGIYQKHLQPNLENLMQTYKSVIKFDKVNTAQTKVNDVKQIMK